MNQAKKRVAVLISGRGSNMRSLVEAARAPGYPAEIVLVVSNRPDAPGLAWAKKEGVPAVALDHERFESRAHFEHQLRGLFSASRVELVALAGFMRLMTPEFVESWRNRMLNIHPSLLPAFKGLKVHERVLAAGVRITGCTVHFVRPEMDEGPIVAQAAVAVQEGDTVESLAARVLEAENRLYPHALGLVASEKFSVSGEIVSLSAPLYSGEAMFSPPL